jgi:hypothetical protein
MSLLKATRDLTPPPYSSTPPGDFSISTRRYKQREQARGYISRTPGQARPGITLFLAALVASFLESLLDDQERALRTSTSTTRREIVRGRTTGPGGREDIALIWVLLCCLCCDCESVYVRAHTRSTHNGTRRCR